ncbi:MAG TPA: hypothetical protein PKM34_01325 [Bacteroidales bacterium]|nr:hypothetical protein [Bacteroidales bacterium]
MTFIVDEHRIAYFDSKPDCIRLALMEDFHTQGKKHLGMPLVCLSPSNGHYVIYRVTDSTRAGRLQFFIDLNLLFVFENIPESVLHYLNDD